MNNTKNKHLTHPGITGKRLLLVYILAVAVAVFTVIHLILPAIALTRKEKVLNCTYQVHTHDDSCYTEIIQEDGTKEKILTCGKADYVVHVHTDDCYQDGVLVCNLPEIEGHKHTSACWKTERVLVCGLEEDDDHTHDDSCYEEQEILVCGKQEMPHIHDDSCYNEDGELICGLLQVEEHVHGKECIEEVKAAGEIETTGEMESTPEMETSAAEYTVEDETSEISQEDRIHDKEAAEQEDGQQDTEDTKDIADIGNTEKAEDSDLSDIYKNGEDPKEEKKPVQSFKAKAGRIEAVVKADQGAFPAGTTMKVKSVKNKKIVNALSDAVSGEVEGVEAVDITFSDADGTEIEPEIPVQVTLTSSRNMDNVEPVVVHMDDEGNTEIVKQEKAADAADSSKDDEKNQVVFEADSFSVYALVYTVDFHYGEYEFNLEGNGEILLSELFGKLGIDEAAGNVTDVSFSDPSLVDIQKLAGDWKLISLQPFHTEEELEVTFADGKILVIIVTDAQYITDLSQIITGIIIRKNGEEMDPEQPVIVRDNDSFSVEMEFTEHDEYQFAIDDTPMYYKMPDGFIIPNGFETTTDVEITVGGKRHVLKNNKVTYDSNNHRMELQWNTTDPEFAYLKMSSDAQVSFSVTGQFEKDVQRDVEFENSITVHIAPPADAGVEKRGEYNMETKRIRYWISVKAEGNVYSDIEISDMLEGTALTYVDTGDNPFVFAWGENKQHTAEDLSAIKSSFEAGEDGKSFRFTIPGTREVPALFDGEVLTLTYEAAVDIEKLEISSTSAYDEEGNIIQEVYDGTGNRVTLSNPGNMYDEPSNNEAIWVEPVQFSDMNKESELSDAKNGVDAQGNDIRYRDITWTITTNSTAEASLAGSQITDTLTYSPDYVTMALQPLTGDEAGIYVQKYDMVEDPADPAKTIEQQVGEGEYIPWTALHIKRSSGKDADGDSLNYINWTYDVPETDGSYKYVITYITRANLKDVTVPSTVFNDVNGKGGHDDAEETLWPEGDGDNISANKTVASTSLEHIEWDIDILARIKEYTDYFRVTDTLPSQWVDRINASGSELRKDSVDISTEDKLAEYITITGLQEGEKWTAEIVKGSSGNADKLLIRFYRNVGTDTEPVWEEGLKSYPENGPEYTTVKVKNSAGEYVTRERRKIHIHLKTDNDQTWIDRATAFMSTKSWIAYHTNKVQVRGDVGDYDFSSATTPVVKPSIIKRLGNDASWLNQYMKVKVRESDGRIVEYPAYRFIVNAGGIRSDNDTVHYTPAGIPYIEVNDVLDTAPDIWKLYKSTDFDTPNNNTAWMDLRVYHAERSGYANESEGAVRIPVVTEMPESFTDEQKTTGVNVLEEKDGEINFKIYYPPKKADGSYYNFYTFMYWLVPKDEAAINTLIQETLKDEHKVDLAHVTKGLVNFTNKAQLILADGDPLEDQADYKYEYNPTSKTVSYDDVNKVAHYTVVLNEQKAKLLSESDTGNEIEMQDEHSANLSVDYSTITITTDPEDKKAQVSYDYSGNVGTFKIPDETKVTISYDARLIATPGTTVNFNNTVEMKGFKTEVTQTQKMSSTSASSAGVYQLELYKYGNGHMESGLAGATFRILDAFKRPIMDRNGDEITFSTLDNGYATITLDESIQGVALKKNTVYYLQELEAPVAYDEDEEPLFYKQDPVYYSFLISDNPDYSAPNGVYVYSNGDILKVRNYEDRGGINISKQFAGNYQLSEEEKQKITFTLQKKAGSNWINVKTLKYSDMRYVDWKEEDGDNITGTYHYSIDNLSPGTYRIVESNMDIADNDVTRVTEYLVDGSSSEMIRQFAVTEEDLNADSPKSHNIVVTNNYYKKIYTFTKQDADSGANLKGAVFSVFKNDEDIKTSEPVRTYTTGEDGSFEISEKDMLEGSEAPAYESGVLYYAVETQAPAGYEMPEEPEKYFFYFGGTVQKPDGVSAVDLSKDFGAATVTNEKAKVSVPVKKVWGFENKGSWIEDVKYVRMGLYQREKDTVADPVPVMKAGEPWSVVLTAEKDTDTTTFVDLPAASNSGNELEYSVQEIGISYDGITESDPEDSFKVTAVDVDITDEEGNTVTCKAINNTDKGISLSIAKDWYRKNTDGSTELIPESDRVGEEYKKKFHLWRTVDRKEIDRLDAVTVETFTDKGKLPTVKGDTVFSPGDTVSVHVERTSGASDGTTCANFSFQYKLYGEGQWKSFTDKDGKNVGSWMGWSTWTYDTEFIIPVDYSYERLILCNWGDSERDSDTITVTLTKNKKEPTIAGLLDDENNMKAVKDTEKVLDFSLPGNDGSWTFSSPLLDTRDIHGNLYTYWVSEDGADKDATYLYRNGNITVSNYIETVDVTISKEWYDQDGKLDSNTGKSGVLFDLYRTTETLAGVNRQKDYGITYTTSQQKYLLSASPAKVAAQPGDILRVTASGIVKTENTNSPGNYYYKLNLQIFRTNQWGVDASGSNPASNRIMLLDGWKSTSGAEGENKWTVQSDGTMTAVLEHVLTESDMPDDNGNFYVRSYGDSPLHFSVEIIQGTQDLSRTQMETYSGDEGATLIKKAVALDSTNNWSYSSVNDIMLPLKSPDGKTYTYFAVERTPDGYEDEYEQKLAGTVIKNKPVSTPQEKGTLRITKNVMEPVPAKANNKSYYFTLSKDGYYYKNDGTAATSPSYSTSLTDDFIHEIKPQNGTYPSVVFEGLPAGSYTVTEILKGERGAEIPNYKLTSLVKVGNQEKANGVVEVIKDAEAVAVIENTYVYGVEMTDITAEKKWRNTEGEEISGLPEDASVTLTLKRYMYDDEGKLIPDDIAWIESDHLAVLDGDMDDGEYEAWKYTWKDLEKVYWNGTEYVDYVYVVEESSVTYNGKTTDDPAADTENWQVALEHDGYTWTVTNTPNIQKVTLKKEWLDAGNDERTWPKDDESWIPVTVLLKKSMDISGVGTRESKDTAQLRLVPDNKQLAQLNSSTGYSITYDPSSGYFNIDGLRDTESVKIGANTYIGKWDYTFEESKVEGYTATVGKVSNGGKLVNTQEPVKKQLGVTKKLTLIDGTTDYAHDWPEEGFTFTLSQQTDQDGVVMPNDVEVTVHKDASTENAAELFDEITFRKPGTFDFIIKEAAGSADNTTYDTAPHSAKVTVKDINGKLTVTDISYDDDQSRLSVVNKHIVNGAVNFKVKKTFEGGTFADKQFSFRLSQVTDVGSMDLESDPSRIKLAEPVTVTTPAEDASEKVMTFDTDIVFTSSGIYYFMIEEIVPETPDTPDASGIYTKYDTHRQWITVNVDADLNVTKSYSSQEDVVLPEDVDAAFVNEQMLDLTATKKWVDSDGRTEITPDADTQVTLALTQWKGTEQIQTFAAPDVEQEGWNFTWKGLKKGYIDEYGISQDYEYQVAETQVSYGGSNYDVENDIAGKYIVTVDGRTVTNRLNTKSVEFGKQWLDKDGNPMQWESEVQQDNNDQPGINYWPEGVKIDVTLKREGDETYSQKFALTPASTETGNPNYNVTWNLPEDGDTNKIFWFSINGLEQYKSDGITEWRYYVTEEAAKVNGTAYLTEYSREAGGAYETVKHGAKQYIINRYPETDVRVTKEWRDTKDKEVKIWPEGKTMTLILYRKAKDAEPEKLAEFKEVSPGNSTTKEITDNGYKLKCIAGYPFTFEVDGLPAADGSKQKYEYYFKENQVSGYGEPIYGNSGTYLGKTDAAYHNGKITNSMPAASFEFHKLWRDEADKDIVWPKGEVINIALYSGENTLVGNVQLTPEGGRMGGYVWTAEADDYSTGFTFRIDDLPKLDDNGEELAYYVKELNAGDGYSASYYYMQTSTVQVDEEDPAAGTTTEYKLSGISTGCAQDGQYIVNRPQNGYELPSTGGSGTKAICLLGIFLTISAGALLLMKKKQLV